MKRFILNYKILIVNAFIGGILLCGNAGRGTNTKLTTKYNIFLNRQPDVAEQSIVASGPFIGRLKPNDPKLDVVRSTEIIFLNHKYHSPSRKAIKPCRLSLLKLAESVTHFFGKKYQLVVTLGYLEKPIQGKSDNSLHLEGRAFNVRLLPADKNVPLVNDEDTKLKMFRKLAGLAYYQAGFNFVHIRRNHVHASCRHAVASSGKQEESHKCFPANGFVRTQNGAKLLMKDVKVGDRLLTINENGEVRHSEIIMMMHQKPDVIVDKYVKITTQNGKNIILSVLHMLFTEEKGAIFAKNVHINLTVTTYDPSRMHFTKSRVVKLSYITEQGAYAPLSMEGTIVVNDIHASCYAVFPSHSISHAVFYFWRQFHKYLNPLITYASSTRENLGSTNKEYHWYPYILKSIVNRMLILPYKM